MKKWIKNITVLSFLLALIVAGGVCNSEAAGHGHGSGAAVKLISSLNPPLSIDQQDQLKSILSTYGPTLKTLRQQVHAAKKQMNKDINAIPAVDATILADAAAVAKIEAQLKAERNKLNSALNGVLTTDQIKQLTQQLTAKFESRLGAKIDHLLLKYARYLEKQ